MGYKWSDKEKEILSETYSKLGSKETAALLGRPIYSVRKMASKLLIKGSHNCRRKYTVNTEFFLQPALLNSYWAGFIAADGCIFERDRAVIISLNEKDENHLQKFCQDTLYTGRITKVRNQTCVSVYGVPQWIENLKEKYKITPRKSLSLSLLPPDLSIQFSFSYIKGYIDGDG